MSGEGGVSQDSAFEQMRERWWPTWCLWRSRDGAGEPNGWCATRRGQGRELSMTLMAATAGELEEALVQQTDAPLIYG
jgi:hypothetical protein